MNIQTQFQPGDEVYPIEWIGDGMYRCRGAHRIYSFSVRMFAEALRPEIQYSLKGVFGSVPEYFIFPTALAAQIFCENARKGQANDE